MKERSRFAANNGITDEWKRFRSFLWENRWFLVLTSLFLILIYGQWIFELSPHIDTEDFINTPYSVYGLQSGRPGKFLTSFLFQLRWYNPFMSSVFGFILLCMSGILFQYLVFRAGNIKCSVSCVFVLIAFCCPIMVEQLYFFSQIFEMAWAYLLCAVAAGLSFYGVIHHSWIARVVSVVSMVWIFGTYQVFTVLYVSTVIVCFVLLYEKWSADNTVRLKNLIFMIGQLIVLFAAAFLLNSIINSIWFSGDAEYLNNMRYWSRDTFDACIRNIQSHIVSGFTGDGIYYSVFYGVFAVTSVLTACYKVWIKRLKTGWLYILAIIMLQLCPFLMTVYLGKEPVIRSQLAYPLVLAFDAVICIHLWSKSIWTKRVFQVLVIVCLWIQLVPTMRMIYTDGIRAQEDHQLMNEISSRIHEVSGRQKPVAFVGTYSNQLNNACLRGKMIGVSIFNIDSGASPHYFFSSVRICENAKVMGYLIEHATEDQVIRARKEALNMPSWPMEGSVKDLGEFIVVKLSDDKWSKEVLTAYLEETDIIDLTKSNDCLGYEIESLKKKDGQLVIRGWMLENGVMTVLRKPVVYLRKNSSGQYYKVATAKQQRTDISSEFGNEEMYRWCGFIALAPLSDLQEPLSDYSLILGYEDCLSGEEYYIDTNINLE